MKTIFKMSFLMLVLGILVSCKGKEDKAVTTTDAGEVAKTEAGAKTFAINTGATKVMWKGSKVIGGSSHQGTLNVNDGSIAVENGEIKGGSFDIDMGSLVSTDLDGEMKGKLEGHLKSEDFFDVAKFPNAKFEITKVTKLQGDADANHMIFGNLTMKDATKQIGFKANVNMAGNAINVSTPKFNINRTDWDVRYGSNKFFDGLKDKAISDDIELSISLIANAK
ncbi:MAG: YceI family protein [Bacteroidota bacterium]